MKSGRMMRRPSTRITTSTAAALMSAPTDGTGDGIRRKCECGYQHQQGNHRHVLEQQHTHDLLYRALSAVAFARPEFRDNGGGRHGQHTAHHQSGLPGGPPPTPRALPPRWLWRPAGRQTDHDAPHGHQLRQGEFQTDGKHQEHHAKFGQVSRSGASGTKPSACGPISTPTMR